MDTKGTTRCSWLFVAITVAALLAATAGVARAQVSGAIYTTTATGADVNGNIYTAKTDVYINGGPQNVNDPGLVPTGFSTDTPAYVTYVFQVTDPSGAVLLSTDDYTCREVLVQDGRIVGATGSCPHALGTFDFANGEQPVQLAPYNDTPNPGGEYKAWLTPLADYKEGCPAGHASYGFCDKDSKTDNFKIHKSGVANVTVCKFNDLSNDGTQNPGDPLIPGWPITATGVDSGGPTVTGRDGCASFTVSSFTDGSASVTLTEGTLDAALWAQTAPANGTCTLTGADSSVPNSNDTCSVAGGTSSTLPSANGVITLTVGPDDNVIAPSFGNAAVSASLVVSKTAYPSYKYTWAIKKTVDENEIDTSSGSGTFNYTVAVTSNGPSGWMVTGDISVYNPNSTDVTGVTVTDAIGDGSSCAVVNGSGITVPAYSQVDLAYTCMYPSSVTAAPAYGTNTATATGTNSDLSPNTGSGTASVDFSAATIYDTSVTVSDTLGGTLGTVSIDPSTLALTTTPNSPTTSSGAGVFNYPYNVTGTPGTCVTQANTATFTTNTTSTTGSSDIDNQPVKVKVCVGADLTVTKSATPAFKRTYAWSILKTATTPSPVNQNSGSATLNYNVKVTETSIVDSNWQVTGSITVTNPNDWQTITATVGDAVDDGGSCSITGGSGTVAPSSSQTLTYTCTYTAQPAYTAATNTATATWSGGSTPHASASWSVGFQFTSPTSLFHQTVTVTDTYNSGTPTTLGNLTAWNSLPYSYTYPVSKTITVPTSGCITVPNTGTIVETNQSSTANIQVCRPFAKTGALTMGFWQNKNGQSIITNAGPSKGTCNLTSWLRQFAPFQDLSSTATCSAVATYVYNVIKAANASGASMNAMLKAQDLATSLDVYFGNGPGGNPIGASTVIGNDWIDLTEVCSVSDQSNGTGTCSGTYINTSAAFGGATKLTVLQIIAYAGSQSTAGGITWYSNVKSVQFLAKDTFDAINNQLAYAP